MSKYTRIDRPHDSPATRTSVPHGDLAARFLDRVDGYRQRYEPTGGAKSRQSGNQPTGQQTGEPNDEPNDETISAPTVPFPGSTSTGAIPSPRSTATSPAATSSPARSSLAHSPLGNHQSCNSVAECEAEQLQPDARELVVLVHGTFAGQTEDAGKSWWQKGSAAWLALRERLPEGVDMPEEGQIFHWSGENSERARIKAGRDLLAKLLELEAADRRYHLIGHSHGGSVIWHALRLATLRRESLDGMRTWTTVGTPFLHYKTHGALSVVNVINLVLGILLLKPAYSAFVGFFGFAWAAICGRNATIDIRSDHEVGLLMALLRKPFLESLHLVGVPITTTETGLRLGTFDPASGQTLFNYLFCSWEGIVVSLVTLAGGYVFLFLASLFLNPVLESLRIRAETRLERTAMETYRGRWLGLWSPDDEAINGLRATLDLTVSFVAHMTPRDRILLSDYLAVVSRPYFWVLEPTFNHFIRPLADRAVRQLVVKTAQGNNRPAAEVVAVSPYPTADSPPGSHPSLPSSVASRLLDDANERARDIAPKFRELLAAPSFISGLERFGTSLSGGELIHTSYFANGEVLDLLALHIAWGRRDMSLARELELNDESLWTWFCAFKHSVRETVEAPLPHRHRVAA